MILTLKNSVMKLILRIVIVLTTCAPLFAQQQDNAQQQREYALTISEQQATKLRTLDPNKAQIVDINGNLQIAVSKKVLRKKIEQSFPQYSNQLQVSSQYNTLNTALSQKDNLYTLLRQKTRTNQDDRALNDAMLDFMRNIENTEFEQQYNDIADAWQRQYGDLDNPPISSELYLLSEFEKNATKTKAILDSLAVPNFKVSLVAFLKNKKGQNKDNDEDRVHIDNFDTYAQGKFYTVERWVTTLSDAQKAQFAQLGQQAQQMNQDGVDVFASLKQKLLSYFSDLSCISDLKTEIEDFLKDPDVVNELTEAVKQDIKNLKTEINTILTVVKAIETDVTQFNINTVFEVIESIKKLTTLLQDFPSLTEAVKNTLNTIDEIESQANTFLGKITSCYDNVKTKVQTIANALGIIKAEQNNYLSNDLIGKEVIAFGIDNLPDTGYISLNYTGERDNGDKLEIDLIVRIPGSGESPKAVSSVGVPSNTSTTENRIIERRLLTMQLIGLRSETAVGIIMADPLNAEKLGDDLPDDRRFLYAPSAALLLKVGSRSSELYNNFIDLGFGVAVSTPDFNTDGTPEFGFGAMFTAFKDLLSIGYNYNVTLDVPYWSIGINLPFNLPGIPINTPK